MRTLLFSSSNGDSFGTRGHFLSAGCGANPLKMKVSSLAGIAYASIISVLHMPREKININADHIILIFYIICAFDGIICPKRKQ